MAQWIRHQPTEPGIVGSSPTGVTLDGGCRGGRSPPECQSCTVHVCISRCCLRTLLHLGEGGGLFCIKTVFSKPTVNVPHTQRAR